jgi:hypothetical protein
LCLSPSEPLSPSQSCFPMALLGFQSRLRVWKLFAISAWPSGTAIYGVWGPSSNNLQQFWTWVSFAWTPKEQTSCMSSHTHWSAGSVSGSGVSGVSGVSGSGSGVSLVGQGVVGLVSCLGLLGLGVLSGSGGSGGSGVSGSGCLVWVWVSCLGLGWGLRVCVGVCVWVWWVWVCPLQTTSLLSP